MKRVISLLILFAILLSNCRESNRKSGDGSAEAIDAILVADQRFGELRNYDCVDTTLSETVRRYVARLDALDFSRCPEDFATAFHAHRDAWEATISFFDQYPELRGEMHELFEAIEQEGEVQKAALQANTQPVWNTWAAVDSLARKYGAL